MGKKRPGTGPNAQKEDAYKERREEFSCERKSQGERFFFKGNLRGLRLSVVEKWRVLGRVDREK